MRRLKSHLPKLGRKKEPIPASHQIAAASSPSNNIVNTPTGDSESHRQDDPALQSSGDTAQDGLAQLRERQDGAKTGDPNGEKTEKLSPILELWDEAYDELCVSEEKKDLMLDYQDQLSKFASAHKDTVHLTQRRQRREQMRVVIDQRTKELKDGRWKVAFGDHSLVLADLVQKVVGIIDWTNTFVGTAVQASPPASLAWAGVCLLLPLVLNPSQQEALRAKALDDIACIISQCTMRETVYRNRYELVDENSVHGSSEYHTSHVAYRDTLKALYTEILTFQATWICFFSTNGFKRVLKDSVKLGDWEDMFTNIKRREENVKDMDELWRDTRYQEDWREKNDQHRERVGKLDEVKEQLSGLREAINAAQHEAKRKNLLNWLTKVDYSTSYNSALQKRHSETSGWLVNKLEVFHKWKDSPNSLLWLHGKAGAGKSVLSAAVIHHLEKLYSADRCTAIAYFFFDFRDKSKQNVTNMARSLIVQLAARRPDTPDALESLRKFYDGNAQPPDDDLLDAIKETTKGFSKVYLVIDALDECPEEDNQRTYLLSMLKKIHSWTQANLHILLTSRMVTNIALQLKPLFKTTVSGTGIIDIEDHQSDVDGDITVFIDNKLKTGDYPLLDEGIKIEIKDTLLKKANGMFQYVIAQFDSDNLKSALNSTDISKALKELPKDLDGTYERALLDLGTLNRKKAVVCLTWIAFALREVTLAELVEAVGLGLSNDPPPLTDEEYSKPKIMEALLQARLLPPGLVVVKDTEDFKNSVSFSHFSVKEYLVSDRITSSRALEFALNEQAAHIQTAQACLRYHLYICKEMAQTEINHAAVFKYPLCVYAAKFGLGHVEAVAREQWTPSLCRRLQDLFEHGGVAFRNLVELRNGPFFSDPDDDSFPSPLYYTCSEGHLQLLKFLLESSTYHVDSLGGWEGTALNCASSGGDLSAMEVLLDAGANPYLGGNTGIRCALEASVKGHSMSATEMLLGLDRMFDQHCAEIGYFPLVDAVMTLRMDLMELLLQHGADINVCSKSGVSVYAWIIGFGFKDAIDLLHKYRSEVLPS